MLAATVLASLVGSSLAFPFLSHWDSEALFRRADISSGCSSTGTESCTNTSAVADLCCFQAPGGLLLQTQFWDTSPPTGPSDSWTIHGLWPDHCDGSFDSTCDKSRAYKDFPSLLTAQGAKDTLDFMNTFWKDIKGKDEAFWEHEWSKHGTCMSTLDVKCLPSGSPKGAEAVIYFKTAVNLFKTLPTHDWLAAAGITPSSGTTHTRASLTDAIKANFGFTPALGCQGSTLNQISYYYHLKGSIIDGAFVAIDAPSAGNCPSSGIKYLTKAGSPAATTKTVGSTTATTATSTGATSTGATSTGATSTGPAAGIPTKATIHALRDGTQVGGLLSLGTWSTQTLATYTLSGTAQGFTLKTNKGSCGVSDGKFSCGNGVAASTFSAATSGGLTLLAFNGDTSFSSDKAASGSTQQIVSTGGGLATVFTLSIVST
ncbi:ribonuclease T2 [Mycena belliarum]|uniref:Ribonuclease T2-like n=1 Tax=Mycena belliarum TaxID=1033014 RepID=A0AAD6UP14_9AGAR|nr:ribonuclease T2 [Mycena belliae]